MQHDPEIIRAVKYCPKKPNYHYYQKLTECQTCSNFVKIFARHKTIACQEYGWKYSKKPIVNKWCCPHCQEPIDIDNYIHLRFCYIGKHESEINREFKIAAINCNHKQKTREAKRRNAAIYRLYKNHNMTPREIAERLDMHTFMVNRIIGNMFAHLCLNDESCIFKPYLQRGKH